LIKKINKNSFSKLANLETLDLSDNEITEFDPIAFKACGPSLKKLLIYNNGFKISDLNVFKTNLGLSNEAIEIEYDKPDTESEKKEFRPYLAKLEAFNEKQEDNESSEDDSEMVCIFFNSKKFFLLC
jgi:hypothetical protein